MVFTITTSSTNIRFDFDVHGQSYFLLFKIGGRLKRRLKNLLIITVVGLGTFYAYRGYRNYRWYSDMSDSDKTIGTKPRIVVLGTGIVLHSIVSMSFDCDIQVGRLYLY